MAKGRNKIRQNQRKTSPGSSVSLEQPRDDAQGSGSPRAAFSPLLSPPHLPWLFSPHHPFIQGMEKREGTGCSQKSRKAPGVGREGERGGMYFGGVSLREPPAVGAASCGILFPSSRSLALPCIPHPCPQIFQPLLGERGEKSLGQSRELCPCTPGVRIQPAGCGERWDPSPGTAFWGFRRKSGWEMKEP